MNIAEIIKENPYSPSPRGHLSTMEPVGREEIVVDFWNFLNHASKGKFVPVILRAPYGGGKTTLLRWFKERLKVKEKLPNHIKGKLILPTYTKLPHPSIKAITTTFIDEVKLQLEEAKRRRFLDHVKTTTRNLEKRKIQTESVLNALIYNSCLDILYTLGFDVIVHIIDEFEAIAEISNEECRGFLHEFRDFIDEIGERPLVMVLGCTDEAYRLMEEIHPALISRVPSDFRKSVDAQLRFTFENTLDFVSSRLESARSTNPEATNPYYPFDRESIEWLYEKAGGNIRIIEQTCYFALEKARKENKKIDQKVVVDAIHRAISQKSGYERSEGTFNLIDDPEERDNLMKKIRQGNPETLKDLLYEGFRRFLSKQNFDYQFERDDDSLGEKTGIARINTHAYRSIPISIAFFTTTVPKEFGYSDIVDAKRIRENFNAGIGIVLRLTQDEKCVNFQDNSVLEISIPRQIFEEFSVLPYVSHLDAEKICRKLEDDLKIITSINRWIHDEVEKGQIIGERFRQYEVSIYCLLWRLGEGVNTIDQILRHSRKKSRKYSKVTLLARLESLGEKGLIMREDESVRWVVSPLMKHIYRKINDDFKGNPVTPMDLELYLMGGSRETLKRYLRLMVRIGILTNVQVGRHTAYKTRNPDAALQETLQKYHDLGKTSQEFSKLPNPIRVEIRERRTHLRDSLKNAQQALKENDDMRVLTNSFRAETLIDEIHKIAAGLKDTSRLIEEEYTMLQNKIERVRERIERCQGLRIDVSVFSVQVDSIQREFLKAYEGEFKIKGKSNLALETLTQMQAQLNTIDESLSRTLELYEKLIDNLERSKKLLASVSAISKNVKISKEDLNENLTKLQSLLIDAEKALEAREFAQAEFLFLKILQNSVVNRTLYEFNMRFSEILAEMNQVKEMASVATRINPEINLMIAVQNLEAAIQETKLFLEEYNLEKAADQIEKINNEIEKLRSDSIKTLIEWFHTGLPEKTVSTPYELSKSFSMPFETVLQATTLLLRNNRLGIVRRQIM